MKEIIPQGMQDVFSFFLFLFLFFSFLFLFFCSHILGEDGKVHMHCFGSGTEMAKNLLDHWTNIYFGFTGSITFSSTDVEKENVIKMIPLNRLLLETDGPL